MRTPNTIPNEEAAKRLHKESEAIFRRLSSMAFEEQSKALEAEDKGNEDKYLKHIFRTQLITMCMDFIAKSPEEFLELINRKL